MVNVHEIYILCLVRIISIGINLINYYIFPYNNMIPKYLIYMDNT